MADLENRIQPNSSPPRMRLPHAAIDVAASQADVAAAFRVLAEAVHTRETSALEIKEVLAERRGVPGKPMLLELLSDLASGAWSVLEREYLRLERVHALPASPSEVVRQSPAKVAGRSSYRDVDYAEFGVLVELDGRAYHDNPVARDRDALRDLEATVNDEALTVRLTYGLVFVDGCRTISKVASLLQRRGWSGSPVRCPDCPDS